MSVQHPAGRHHEVRGHRLWVETEGSGVPLPRSGSFGHAEEPETVFEQVREFVAGQA